MLSEWGGSEHGGRLISTGGPSVRTIGLADSSGYTFRVALEGLLAHAAPEVQWKGESFRVSAERVKTVAYDLSRPPARYDAILHRPHRVPHLTSAIVAGHPETPYVLNNLMTLRTLDKNATFSYATRLGLPVPLTWALPPRDHADLPSHLPPHLFFADHVLFDLHDIGDTVGYPAYLKPQDGRASDGVARVESWEELEVAYARSGTRPMNLQRGVQWSGYLRCLVVGPAVLVTDYNPDEPLSHERYRRVDLGRFDRSDVELAAKLSRIVSAVFDWDYNSCEVAFEGHSPFLIDFANSYPDNHLAVLRQHFPDLVVIMAKWLVYAVVNGRTKPVTGPRGWDAFWSIAHEGRAKRWDSGRIVEELAGVAEEVTDAERFAEFVDEALTGFDDRAREYFTSLAFERLIEEQVTFYFPAHDVDAALEEYRGVHASWVDRPAEQVADMVWA